MSQPSGLQFTARIGALPTDTFAVVEFELTEQLSDTYTLNFELASVFAEVAVADVLDQPAELSIYQDGDLLRRVQGIASEFQQGDSGHHRTRYSVTVVPALWRLALMHNCRIFQQRNPRQMDVKESNNATDVKAESVLFECLGCQSAYTPSYSAIGSLLRDGNQTCQTCHTVGVLSEEDRNALRRWLGIAERRGKAIVAIALVFFPAALVLGLIYGGLVSVAVAVVGVIVGSVLVGLVNGSPYCDVALTPITPNEE